MKRASQQEDMTADPMGPLGEASGTRCLLRLVEDKWSQPSVMFDSMRKHKDTPEKTSEQMRIW